jgi:glutathione S-transferase
VTPVAIVIGFALLEFFIFGLLVGRARSEYGIEAPATSGHPIFERTFRVHQNTMEQLVIFLPSIWIFGSYVSPLIAAILGLFFIAGRIVYFRGYVREPRERATGVAITSAAQSVLLLGGIVGAVVAWLR